MGIPTEKCVSPTWNLFFFLHHSNPFLDRIERTWLMLDTIERGLLRYQDWKWTALPQGKE